MSENKKYFYLKLKDSFFNNDDMKILESLENGFIYEILYLKLCLLSLKYEGKLAYKGVMPYDIKMISTLTAINQDIIRSALKVFSDLGLIEKLDNGIIYITEIQSLIGHGSTEGERKLQYRKKIEQLKLENGTMSAQCPEVCPPELELETKTDIEKELNNNMQIVDEKTSFSINKEKSIRNQVRNKERFSKKEYMMTVQIPDNINTTEFSNVWKQWAEYRGNIKKELSKQSIDKQLEKLSEWGIEQSIQSINASIMNGWQGLFPVKQDRPAPQQYKNSARQKDEMLIKSIQRSAENDRKRLQNSGGKDVRAIANSLLGHNFGMLDTSNNGTS